MTVTETNVRDCLNNISTDEVATATVTDKIDDAEAWVDNAGGDPADGDWGERACKYYAAYLSYIVSNSYLEATAGPIRVREPYEIRAKSLLEQAEEALAKALDMSKVMTKKIPLLREYTSEEQERDPDVLNLQV
jgi:hypothetical protein